jgi:hypothetical protein
MEAILDKARARTERPGADRGPWPAGRDRDDEPQMMSFVRVRGLFGSPTGKVVFGNKARGSFADMTVVFEDGKVTEVKL